MTHDDPSPGQPASIVHMTIRLQGSD